MPKIPVLDFENELIKETSVELDLLQNTLYVDDEIEEIESQDLPKMSTTELIKIQTILIELNTPDILELLDLKKWGHYCFW